MSVRTPILTTSSETCASAALDASIAAASIPSLDRFLANILSSPPWNRRVGRWCLQAVAPPIRLICNYFAPASTWPNGGARLRAVPGSVYFRPDSGHRQAMTSPQRLPTSLTPLDTALDALLQGVEPVAPVELTLVEALRCIAAEMPPLKAHPPRDIAAADGYAFGARDLVGVSSYSPLPLTTSPVWVEAGEAMPDGCDCVLDSDSIDLSGPLPQVLAEAIPGQGVRRAGGDIAAGCLVAEAGRRVLPRDLLVARAAGIERLSVRRPRLGVVNVPGGAVTADLIAESARAAGAEIVSSTAAGRDAGSIAAALDHGAYDLLLTIGGSGVGRTDAAVTALAARGKTL